MQRGHGAFRFPELFGELQGEIRRRCTLSARCMLAMTCREERKRVAGFFRGDLVGCLLFEGDPHHLLRRYLLTPPEKKHFPPQKMHRLLCDAIQCGQAELVMWLINDGRWRTCGLCRHNILCEPRFDREFVRSVVELDRKKRGLSYWKVTDANLDELLLWRINF